MIEFPDVSNNNGPVDLTGALAAFCKASEGASFVDAYYVGHRDQAAALGIPFAGYHWVNGDDLAAQAANAHAVLGSTPAMWDAEANGATVPRLVELTQRFQALGGQPRLLYLPYWWWLQLGQPDLRPLARLGLALISSDYDQTAPDGWQPYGGMTPPIWQYTSAHPFNGHLVDFNRYQGTAAQLAALLEGDTVSADDVIVGESELFDQAAGRSTPTGRNFANDFYAAVSAALADEFKAVQAKLDQILANQAAPAVSGTGTFTFTPAPPAEAANP